MIWAKLSNGAASLAMGRLFGHVNHDKAIPHA